MLFSSILTCIFVSLNLIRKLNFVKLAQPKDNDSRSSNIRENAHRQREYQATRDTTSLSGNLLRLLKRR